MSSAPESYGYEKNDFLARDFNLHNRVVRRMALGMELETGAKPEVHWRNDGNQGGSIAASTAKTTWIHRSETVFMRFVVLCFLPIRR